MKSKTLFLLSICISLILYSCGNDSKINEKINDVDPKSSTTKKEQVPESNPRFSKLRKEYISLYDTTIDFHLTHKYNSVDSVTSILKYICLKDSALTVPNRFVHEQEKDFITHNFLFEVIIISNNDTIYNKTIDKKYFDLIIDEELKSYATFLKPTKYTTKFIEENNQFVYGFNLTIPVTDIGIGVKLYVNINGTDSISSVL